MIAVFPNIWPDEDIKSAATAMVILELAGMPLMGVIKTFLPWPDAVLRDTRMGMRKVLAHIRILLRLWNQTLLSTTFSSKVRVMVKRPELTPAAPLAGIELTKLKNFSSQ
jgi:hypothetical protein